ncbi:signal peptidase I [Microbacterium hominis]|uniref:signal peptidase I n=1 Tax=Microbacterium hominis TaxID=162426 RepID=UPI0020B8D478|nr:signal peptidase I [Microbacterium hominis]
MVAAVVVVVLALIALRLWVFDIVTVASGSMAPTLCAGDLVLVERVAPWQRLEHGDIVVFANPGDGSPTVKRVVGLPGEQVGIADAILTVDGEFIDESYVDRATIDGVYFGPVEVPPDTVFVMGDAREFSIDSREFGAVPREDVSMRMLVNLSGCR